MEVLADIAGRRRPAADSLKDWGLAHRFAGSGDRAAIAALVYDVLRRRNSAAWLMGLEEPRARVLGALRLEREMPVDDIARLCAGERFAPAPLTGDERARLRGGLAPDAPSFVLADVPEWLIGSLQRAFGDDVVSESTALAKRAPLDLRVNSLVASRELVAAELAHLGIEPTPYSPWGLRIAPSERGPSIQSDPVFLQGQVEIQDEGSQLAALLSGVQPRQQVVDLCAGGGGKTLALAAAMNNTGQVYATDSDQRRLAPIRQGGSRRRALWAGRPRPRRCALHGNRNVAPQPGFEVARAAREPRDPAA
jgi:16S rRNA (cytosine967-C5)-methyltransferase